LNSTGLFCFTVAGVVRRRYVRRHQEGVGCLPVGLVVAVALAVVAAVVAFAVAARPVVGGLRCVRRHPVDAFHLVVVAALAELHWHHSHHLVAVWVAVVVLQ